MVRRVLPLCVIAVVGCNDNALVSAPTGCTGDTATPSAIHADQAPRVDRRPGHPVRPPAPSMLAAASGDDLVRAMGQDPSSPVTYIGHPHAAATFNGLGVLDPIEGNSFAWLSTGIAGAGTPEAVAEDFGGPQDGTDFGLGGCTAGDTFDCVQLRYTFEVPEGAHSLRFDFNFLSTEYPEYVAQGFNDRFVVSLESPSHNYSNIVFDNSGDPIGIDSAFFDETCPDFAGTGFDLSVGDACDAGATGLLGTIAPVEPGETVSLTFMLQDAGDGIFDSAVMIDNLQTGAEQIEEPETSDCD